MNEVANKVYRGSFGKLYINNTRIAEIKSFELKVSLDYEEIKVNGDMATYQRYMGYALSGTMVTHKVSSYNASLIQSGLKTGSLPDIKFVASINDPDNKQDRIEVLDVTFDEVTLLQFANGEVGEESTPFKAGSFNFIDIND